MENITTKEVMEKLDMFQARFGKLDEFCLWDLEIIRTDAGMKFTSKELQEGLYLHRLCLTLAAPDHQEIKGHVEVTLHSLRTIAHSIMVHVRVLDEYPLVVAYVPCYIG